MNETVEEALGVLADVADWQLLPQQWGRVRDALQQMAAALDSGGPGRLGDAIAVLEEAGPTRILRITDAATGIPDEVLDLCNELVHSLVRKETAR